VEPSTRSLCVYSALLWFMEPSTRTVCVRVRARVRVYAILPS